MSHGNLKALQMPVMTPRWAAQPVVHPNRRAAGAAAGHAGDGGLDGAARQGGGVRHPLLRRPDGHQRLGARPSCGPLARSCTGVAVALHRLRYRSIILSAGRSCFTLQICIRACSKPPLCRKAHCVARAQLPATASSWPDHRAGHAGSGAATAAAHRSDIPRVEHLHPARPGERLCFAHPAEKGNIWLVAAPPEPNHCSCPVEPARRQSLPPPVPNYI